MVYLSTANKQFTNYWFKSFITRHMCNHIIVQSIFSAFLMDCTHQQFFKPLSNYLNIQRNFLDLQNVLPLSAHAYLSEIHILLHMDLYYIHEF